MKDGDDSMPEVRIQKYPAHCACALDALVQKQHPD
jgi:hypothetical protein